MNFNSMHWSSTLAVERVKVCHTDSLCHVEVGVNHTYQMIGNHSVVQQSGNVLLFRRRNKDCCQMVISIVFSDNVF